MSASSAVHFAHRCRKIVAVGRNFAAHAKELNNPIPTTPLLFLKPPSAIITKGQTIKLPRQGKIEHTHTHTHTHKDEARADELATHTAWTAAWMRPKLTGSML